MIDTVQWRKFIAYLASFGINVDKINLQTITKTGYDAIVENDGQKIPVFRFWPSSMDVEYLFKLGMEAINSESND
jgi:hypothetical protein